MKNSCLAIIPARGGSKGIPRKNIVKLNGFPLISYVISAALTSKSVSKVVVSSEDEEILRISINYGAKVIKRPQKLARDDSTTDTVINHCLDTLKIEEDFVPESIVLLQPTSPLRTSLHIDEAFRLFKKNSSQAVISVFEPSHHPLKSFKINKSGYLKGLVNNKNCFLPRQQLPKVFMPNGAIFIIKTVIFKKYKTLLPPRTIPYFMSKLHSVEVDDIDDLNYAAYLMQKSSL